MAHKYIKVTYDNKEEYCKNKAEIARKFNYTPQHILGVLKGTTLNKFIIFNDTIVKLEYANDDENNILLEKQKLFDQNIIKEKRREHDKKIYQRRKNAKLPKNDSLKHC